MAPGAVSSAQTSSDPGSRSSSDPSFVDHDVGDLQAAPRGSPGRRSGPWRPPRSCRAARPAGRGAPRRRRRRRSPRRTSGPGRSPPAAARRRPRSRRRARRPAARRPCAPTSGCTIALSEASFSRVGEDDRAELLPVERAVGAQHLRRRTPRPRAASPGVPGSTTSRAILSASITTAPRAASRRDTSLLPDPMPPVSPTFSMTAAYAVRPRPGPRRWPLRSRAQPGCGIPAAGGGRPVTPDVTAAVHPDDRPARRRREHAGAYSCLRRCTRVRWSFMRSLRVSR